MFYDDGGADGSTLTLWQRLARADAHARKIALLNPHQAGGALLGPGVFKVLLINDERPEIGGDHFLAQPVMRVYEPDLSRYIDLGPGENAVLSPDGAKLAWLAPTRIRTCTVEEDSCHEPPVRIVVAPMNDLRRQTTWGPYENVRGLRWAAEDQLIIGKRHGDALFDLRSGAMRDLDLSGDVAAVNPATERLLLASDALHTLTLAGYDGRVIWRKNFSRERFAIAWSPDGRTLIVELTRALPDASAITRLLVIDTVSGAETDLREPASDGDLVWSTSGATFGYRRVTASSNFEYVLCPRVTPKTCRVVFTWKEGIHIQAVHD